MMRLLKKMRSIINALVGFVGGFLVAMVCAHISLIAYAHRYYEVRLRDGAILRNTTWAWVPRPALYNPKGEMLLPAFDGVMVDITLCMDGTRLRVDDLVYDAATQSLVPYNKNIHDCVSKTHNFLYIKDNRFWQYPEGDPFKNPHFLDCPK